MMSTDHNMRLTEAIIAALPSGPRAPPQCSSDSAASDSEEETDSEEEEVHIPRRPVLSRLEETPKDIIVVLITMLDLLDLTAMDMSPMPPQALTKQKRRLKALLSGLFPGIREELYCTLSHSNGNMYRGLVKSIERHVESIILVWRSESEEGVVSVMRKKANALGYELADIPVVVVRAIECIGIRVGADMSKVALHRLLTGVLAATHALGEACKGATGQFWLLKALAQLLDLCIHHADKATVVNARRALLPGWFLQMMLKEPPLEKEHLARVLQALEEAVQRHALAARELRKNLRVHLEDVADFGSDDWGAEKEDVAHLIYIFAWRVDVDLRKAAAIQNLQKAAKPQSGLSKAGQAEKREAKKARQRAARAQAAAQTVQAKGKSSKAPALAESGGSDSKLERAAEAQAACRLQEADCSIGESVPAATENLPASRAPADSSKTTGNGKNSHASRQPPLQLCSGAAHEEQENVSPRWAAPAAQALGPDAQREEPWQEVRKPQRRGGQRVASHASARKQGRVVPEHKTPALPPLRPIQLQTPAQPADQAFVSREKTAVPPAQSASCLRDLQAAPQSAGQASVSSERAVVAPHAQPGHVAAKQLPGWLSELSCAQPQQPPQRHGQHPLPSAQSQALPTSTLHEPLQERQESIARVESSAAPQPIPYPGLRFGTFSPNKATNADLSEEEACDEEDLCIVCWEELREVIFYHCMHMCTCQGCAKDIMAAGGLCPMCRSKIQTTITARF